MNRFVAILVLVCGIVFLTSVVNAGGYEPERKVYRPRRTAYMRHVSSVELRARSRVSIKKVQAAPCAVGVCQMSKQQVARVESALSRGINQAVNKAVGRKMKESMPEVKSAVMAGLQDFASKGQIEAGRQFNRSLIWFHWAFPPALLAFAVAIVVFLIIQKRRGG